MTAKRELVFGKPPDQVRVSLLPEDIVNKESEQLDLHDEVMTEKLSTQLLQTPFNTLSGLEIASYPTLFPGSRIQEAILDLVRPAPLTPADHTEIQKYYEQAEALFHGLLNLPLPYWRVPYEYVIFLSDAETSFLQNKHYSVSFSSLDEIINRRKTNFSDVGKPLLQPNLTHSSDALLSFPPKVHFPRTSSPDHPLVDPLYMDADLLANAYDMRLAYLNLAKQRLYRLWKEQSLPKDLEGFPAITAEIDRLQLIAQTEPLFNFSRHSTRKDIYQGINRFKRHLHYSRFDNPETPALVVVDMVLLYLHSSSPKRKHAAHYYMDDVRKILGDDMFDWASLDPSRS
ncbi:MAG: hypothetical protein GXP63_01590 [DPANN group archaeon]|nr:hypothetical protein [DPANN group archaeon]